MNLLVYAITRDDARAPAAHELQEICAVGLRALAEPIEHPPAADLEQLVRYEEKVEAVMRDHTVLPMRFGSVVDGEDGLRDLLKSRAHEFMETISHLDVAVEYAVQASTASADAATESGASLAGSGEGYMRGRLREQHVRRDLQAWLDGALDGVVRESVYRTTPVRCPGALSAACLVDSKVQNEFLTRLAELADTTDNSLSWSGPWPPYSFTGGLSS